MERNNQPLSGWNDTKKLIIIYGIAAGMSYLHSNNILHRDLKNENIYLDENMFPKIGDFGILKRCFSIESMSFQSTSGIKGTPVYSSPEILQSNDYSKSSDVYAFAFIVYELMTNDIPFKNLSMNQIFNEVVINENRPEFYKSIPNCYQQLIENCWLQDPKERMTFDEIINYLKNEKEFITESINCDEFNSYIRSIDNFHETIEFE